MISRKFARTFRGALLSTMAMSAAPVAAAQASVTISRGATKNMSCSGAVCSPTAKKAVLNVDDLTNMLATNDVKITTGHGAVTITVASPFSWTSKHRLTLDAKYNVSFRAAVTVAGQGAVTITYNDGGRGGDLRFLPTGKLDFWDTGSNLIVNQTSYSLERSIKHLAAAVKIDEDGDYALANDYDATRDGTYAHAPVGNFYGAFEGLGHTVSNLSINAKTDAGLFQAIAFSGTARDINLADASVSATKDYINAGVLAGSNYGIVAHASASGTLQGIATTGRGVSGVGGLVGLNVNTIADSSASATVTGGDHSGVGGLVGVNANGATILRSYASGDVSGGNKSFIGGLVGFSYGLSDCYALGAVEGGSHSYVGGLIGSGDKTGRSYSTGTVVGRSGASVGGSMGDARGGDADVYWDLDTSGTSQGCGTGDCGGISGLSDSQLKSGLPDGFDPAVWGQKKDINNGYPYLLANPPE